jgi:hypothetical protein
MKWFELLRVLDKLITQYWVHESETKKNMCEAVLKMFGAKANVVLGIELRCSSVSLLQIAQVHYRWQIKWAAMFFETGF